jgi:predicted kinase
VTPRVLILIGLPGSGKSTWAARHRGSVLSSDMARGLLTGDETDQSANARVFGLLRRILSERLALRQPLTIIDATNLTRKERKQWLRVVERHGAAAEAVVFDTPVAICKRRNAKRARVVPEEVIDRMAARLRPPAKEEGFHRITSIRA